TWWPRAAPSPAPKSGSSAPGCARRPTPETRPAARRARQDPHPQRLGAVRLHALALPRAHALPFAARCLPLILGARHVPGQTRPDSTISERGRDSHGADRPSDRGIALVSLAQPRSVEGAVRFEPRL